METARRGLAGGSGKGKGMVGGRGRRLEDGGGDWKRVGNGLEEGGGDGKEGMGLTGGRGLEEGGGGPPGVVCLWWFMFGAATGAVKWSVDMACMGLQRYTGIGPCSNCDHPRKTLR